MESEGKIPMFNFKAISAGWQFNDQEDSINDKCVDYGARSIVGTNYQWFIHIQI
jgi:hypothetical protein